MCPRDKLLHSATVSKEKMNDVYRNSMDGRFNENVLTVYGLPTQVIVGVSTKQHQNACLNRYSPNRVRNSQNGQDGLERSRKQDNRRSSRSTEDAGKQLTPSPTRAYAGAKCHEAPSPTYLPAPPMHWTNSSCAEMTNMLKVMLKVS